MHQCCSRHSSNSGRITFGLKKKKKLFPTEMSSKTKTTSQQGKESSGESQQVKKESHSGRGVGNWVKVVKRHRQVLGITEVTDVN